MDKYTLLKEALYIYNPNIDSIFKKYQLRHPTLTVELFLATISKDSYRLIAELPIGTVTISKLLKEIFPDRVTSTTGGKPCVFLLGKFEYKWCGHCKQVLEFEDFRKNANLNFGLNSYCRACQSITTASTQSGRQSQYKSNKLKRTPSWAELEDIKVFYNNCPKGYHVDHIIPLQGKLVSGLHVLSNLQYLTALENTTKYNKFSIS